MTREEVVKKLNDLHPMLLNKFRYQEFLLDQFKTYIGQFQTVFLWGAGYDGRMVVDFLGEALSGKEVYFIDSNPEKIGMEIYKGISCVGLEDVYEHNLSQTLLLITTSLYADQIMSSLGMKTDGTGISTKMNRVTVCKKFIEVLVSHQRGDLGLSEILPYWNRYQQVLKLLDDETSIDLFYRRILGGACDVWFIAEFATFPQYFPEEIQSRLRDDEVFLDCGAARGDSVEAFREQTEDRFRAIYSFEMDDSIFQELSRSPHVQDSRITLIPAGVSDREQRVRYLNINGCPTYAVATVSVLGDQYADVISIDSLVEKGVIKEKVTFVKMDIEGAELDALHGMEKMMKRDRPKLAICVYHKAQDLWKIPLYIHDIVPEYRFVLRHHSSSKNETVLYAFMEQ